MQAHLNEPIFTQKFGHLRISPLYFGQRRLANKHYLPPLLMLPDDLDFSPIPFGWGVFGPGPGLTALGQGYLTYQVSLVTWIWGLCGGSNDATGPGGSNSGFQVNLIHTHNGNQYQFFNRPAFNLDVLGTGTKPMILRAPHMLLPGDSLSCQVNNLGNPVAPVVTSIRVLLLAGQAAKPHKPAASNVRQQHRAGL